MSQLCSVTENKLKWMEEVTGSIWREGARVGTSHTFKQQARLHQNEMELISVYKIKIESVYSLFIC